MFKGIQVPVPENIRTLLYKASKDCKVCLRSCQSGVKIGDATVSLTSGYILVSQECADFELKKNDELYAISDCSTCVWFLVCG